MMMMMSMQQLLLIWHGPVATATQPAQLPAVGYERPPAAHHDRPRGEEAGGRNGAEEREAQSTGNE
jgi:hypothetical protein